MVTVSIGVCESLTNNPLEDAQVTIGEETEVTDAKGKCLFKNIKHGVYDVRIFKDGGGCSVFQNIEIKDTHNVFYHNFGILMDDVFIKLSADKTKIKKNETVTIVAQLFKHDIIVTDLKQISFSINGTQKVISDFDTDKEIAIMTLKGSNQGKVKITAHAQYRHNNRFTAPAYSNALFIQDGHEE